MTKIQHGMKVRKTAQFSEEVLVSPWEKSVYDKNSFPSKSKDLYYSHIVHRTLIGDHSYVFLPDYVFYVGKYPAAYIKTVDQFSEPDIRKWQLFIWNQSVVPLLILQTQTQLRVYSSSTKPSKDGYPVAITEILEKTTDALEMIQAKLETGDFYQEHAKQLSRTNRVDQHLLQCLKDTAIKIAESRGTLNTENLEFANRFLTRILFVCYLIERGMIKGNHFHTTSPLHRLCSPKEGKPFLLKDLLANETTAKGRKNVLIELFRYVKTHFNGSLFPESLSSEAKQYDKALTDLLLRFLKGDDLNSGQLTLDFWAFDFSIIPVETISSIYEDFLRSQAQINESHGKGNSQRESGAYYTPPHLAELVVDIALEKIDKPYHELTVLDPACGSGIFLVTMLGRMADSLRIKNGYKGKRPSPKWGKAVLDLLPQLHGIDTNSMACHIACFSLYLAALEQMSPTDVEALNGAGHKFPPLLNDTEKKISDGQNIVHDNFFSPNLTLKQSSFDLVVGNPPWVSRGQQKDEMFLAWMRSEGKKQERILAPGSQIAHGFMWKTTKWTGNQGHVCLLLPSSVFLNSQTNEFQEKWLNKVTIKKVVNFSDLRFVLFEGAIHPCMAVRFSRQSSQENENQIRYESPKTDFRSQKGGPIYVREEDIAFLKTKDILIAAKDNSAPKLWKGSFRGTWQDKRLISRLADLSTLKNYVEDTRSFSRRIKKGDHKRYQWLKGQGVNRGNMTLPGWWNDNTLYIRGTNIPPIAIQQYDCTTVSKAKFPSKAERPRIEQLFQGPKILISEGVKNPKAAYCNFKVLFQNSLVSIAGQDKDKDVLLFLTMVLQSDIINYYLFHTSSNWGGYRPEIHVEERLSIPFFIPLDAQDPQQAKQIVKAVSHSVKEFQKRMLKCHGFGQEEAASKLRVELEPLVREYYQIDPFESILIDDTLTTVIPSSTPSEGATNIPTLRRTLPEEQIAYADTLCDMLANFCGKDTLGKIRKTPYAATIHPGHPYSVIQLSKVTNARKTERLESPPKLRSILKRLYPLLNQHKGNFAFCSNLKVFCDGALYILKPPQYRFWMKSAALNDADEIASAVLTAQENR